MYRTHVHERDDTESRLEQCQEGIEKCQSEKPRLEKQYRFYQEMRMFTRNLVECLNEKVAAQLLNYKTLRMVLLPIAILNLRMQVPQIEYLERCMHHHLKARAERLAKRRQEDVKDQSDDSSAGSHIIRISLKYICTVYINSTSACKFSITLLLPYFMLLFVHVCSWQI